MNTKQIYSVLSQHPITSGVFCGVYASNKLPHTKLERYPAAFVANVDPDTKPGSHWVAFYIQDKWHGEYFDSYGRPPLQKAFIRFLQRNCTTWVQNRHHLQGAFSSVCGQYVLYYLLHRSQGQSMDHIVNNFVEDKDMNDFYVNDFIEKNMGLITPIYDVDFLTSQISKSFIQS